MHPRMAFFVELTNGHGTYNTEIRIVDAANDNAIIGMKGPAAFKDPRSVCRICFEIGNVVIPKEGEYRLQIICDGTLVMERRFVAKLLRRQGNQDEQH